MLHSGTVLSFSVSVSFDSLSSALPVRLMWLTGLGLTHPFSLLHSILQKEYSTMYLSLWVISSFGLFWTKLSPHSCQWISPGLLPGSGTAEWCTPQPGLHEALPNGSAKWLCQFILPGGWLLLAGAGLTLLAGRSLKKISLVLYNMVLGASREARIPFSR